MSSTKILLTEVNGNTSSTINSRQNIDDESNALNKDANCKYNNSRKNNFIDIICDNSPIRISAILHAAEISPLVFGNSFSPPEKLKSQKVLINKSNPIPNTKLNSPIKINLSETLALDMVNHNFSVKKQQKELLKKQLEDRQNFLQKENIKRREILESTINKRNNWVLHKLQNDKNIYETAENFANQTAEQNDVQVKKIQIDKENKLKQISYEAIAKYQIKFKECYENLTRILLSFDKNSINCEKYNNNLKELISNFENLIKKIKNYEIGPSEISYAELLYNRIRSLEIKLISDAANIKQEQQQQQLQQLQQQQQPVTIETGQTLITTPLLSQPEQQQITIKPIIQQTNEKSIDIPDSNNKLDYVSCMIGDNSNFYTDIMNCYNEKLERIKSLKSDDNMKKFRTGCKRIINVAVSSICAVSPQHLQDKFDKIFNFITGKNATTDVNILEHPLGKDFCLVLLASILVKQGDTEVSSNSKAAFPIASIIVSIWNRIPEFGKIFLGHIFKESPYLVPIFIPKHKNQSNESYLKLLGYQMVDGGLEQQNVFLARQSGIMRLYAAVMVTAGRRADGQNHPYGIENGWRWICNFTSLNPLPDICATLLYEFLQTAGYEMWSTYGQQFRKVLLFIQQEYIPLLSKIEDREPPKLRLEGYLQQILQKNKIDKPNGTLSKNYW